MREPVQEKELTAGDFVTNGVRLLRRLAEGGMGRVWIAEHLGLRTEVVVKVMAREMVARPDGTTRFAREAAIAAAIKSPHVVQVFDHGISAKHDVPYIVMERLEGRDLGQMLAEHGRLEPSETAAVIVQIGKALTKAHKAGIVQRDIKPENIFLCTPDVDQGSDAGIFAKLLDFGTAKRDQHASSPSATQPGEIMGTPYYMSPEQSVGAMLDERTDLWSLGVVAFEAPATGQEAVRSSKCSARLRSGDSRRPDAERSSDPRRRPRRPSLDGWFAKACSARAAGPLRRATREMTASFFAEAALTGVGAGDRSDRVAGDAATADQRFLPAAPPGSASDEMRKTVCDVDRAVHPPPALARAHAHACACAEAGEALFHGLDRGRVARGEAARSRLGAKAGEDRGDGRRPTAAGVMAGIVLAELRTLTATTTTTAREPTVATVAPCPPPEPVATHEFPLPPGARRRANGGPAARA